MLTASLQQANVSNQGYKLEFYFFLIFYIYIYTEMVDIFLTVTHLFMFTGANVCHSNSHANGKNCRKISKNYTPGKHVQVNRQSKRSLMQTNIQKNDDKRSKRLRFIECKS